MLFKYWKSTNLYNVPLWKWYIEWVTVFYLGQPSRDVKSSQSNLFLVCFIPLFLYIFKKCIFLGCTHSSEDSLLMMGTSGAYWIQTLSGSAHLVLLLLEPLALLDHCTLTPAVRELGVVLTGRRGTRCNTNWIDHNT